MKKVTRISSGIVCALFLGNCAHIDGDPEKTIVVMYGIKEDLKAFEQKCRVFPEPVDWSTTLRDNPCAKTVMRGSMTIADLYKRPPTDYWNKPILLVRSDKGTFLLSLGRDGLPGGHGEDADILLKVK